MIRILIADDQDLLCEILQNSLADEPDLEIVGVANNGKAAIEKTDILRPDIVLIDINMPVMNGLEATEIIDNSFPETKVIILSGSDEELHRDRAFNAGARSYISKTSKARDIIEQIRKVHLEHDREFSESTLKQTIMQLNQVKQEIQNHVEQVQQKIHQFEHTEAKMSSYFGKLDNDREKLSKEVVSFKSNIKAMVDDLHKSAKESKKHSAEISRIQSLVEGQLSYIHNLNNQIKYFRKYLTIVTVAIVITLIVAIIGLIF